MSIEDPFPELNNDNQPGYVIDNDRLNCLTSLTRASLNSESEENDFTEKVKKEIQLFRSLLNEKDLSSTVKFWRENKRRLPCLFKLVLRLLTIPTTSAEAERFFSVVGKINAKASNISDITFAKKD